jgi:phage head maturation protease
MEKLKVRKHWLMGEIVTRAQEESSEGPKKITVVASTGYKGLRKGFGSAYYEELEISERAIDFSRLNSGSVPFLKDHDASSVDNVIGSVTRSWIEDGKLMAEVTFSTRSYSQGFIQDIEAGVLRNISVGYLVHEYKEIESKTDFPTYLATRWEPLEISLVAIPFDPNAQVVQSRSENSELETHEALVVKDELLQKRELEEWVASQQVTDEVKTQLLESSSIEEASKRLLELTTNNNKQQEQEKTMDQKRFLQEYLEARVLQNKKVENLTFLQAAQREFPKNPGESDAAYIKRLTLTSDLPELLANVGFKAIANQPGKRAPFVYEKIARVMDLPDFKQATIPHLGAVVLSSKTEGGAYSSQTLADSGANIQLEERGRIVEISQKALINDDLSILKQLPRYFADAGKRDIESRVIAELTAAGNYTAANTVTSTSTSLGMAELAEAEEKMMAFADDSGEPLGLRIKYLVVNPQQYLDAMKLASSIQPDSSSSVNPWAGNVEVLTHSSIPNKKIYCVADPAEWTSLVVGVLDGVGEEGQISVDTDFKSSNYLVKFECPNATKAVTTKGLVRIDLA